MDPEVKELFEHMMTDLIATRRVTDIRGDTLPRDTHI